MRDITGEIRYIRTHLDVMFSAMQKMQGSREFSLAITALQESKMWLGKVLQEFGEANPYPESKNPESKRIEPTAEHGTEDLHVYWDKQGYGVVGTIKDLRKRIEALLPQIWEVRTFQGNGQKQILYADQSYLRACASMMWLGMALGVIRDKENEPMTPGQNGEKK